MLLCGHALEHYENWLNTTTRTRVQSKAASSVELLNYLISRIKFFGSIIYLEPLSRYIVYSNISPHLKCTTDFKKKWCSSSPGEFYCKFNAFIWSCSWTLWKLVELCGSINFTDVHLCILHDLFKTYL